VGHLYLTCYLVVGLMPLPFAYEIIERRAKVAGVRPLGYQTVSTLAAWLGLFVTPALIIVLFNHEKWFRERSHLPGFVVVGLVGWLAGAVGAWSGVRCLRTVTVRDPDYDERRRPDSLEADVHQPRYGDHVRPD